MIGSKKAGCDASVDPVQREGSGETEGAPLNHHHLVDCSEVPPWVVLLRIHITMMLTEEDQGP